MNTFVPHTPAHAKHFISAAHFSNASTLLLTVFSKHNDGNEFHAVNVLEYIGNHFIVNK